MEVIAFFLIGSATGAASALMLLRFDAGWLKAFSLSGGASVLIGEFLAFAELLGINSQNRSIMLVTFLAAWILIFFLVLMVLLRSFKRQETKYKIQTWEILLGDKKAIDQYYNSKKNEIARKIEEDYNLEKLTSIKNDVDRERLELEAEKSKLHEIKEEAANILDTKHKIKIPKSYEFPIKYDFFSLLPRYIKSIAQFEHHLSSFTASFIKDENSKQVKSTESRLLKTYLTGVSLYIGQCLFEWRDVRVHFRVYNEEQKHYTKYVAVHKNGTDYTEDITIIPSDSGLIALATNLKRSVVYSANKSSAFSTGSEHIWKDYITMIFEKLHIDGTPVLSLGVSVKHHVDHKEMLYFLSYIQIEQVIQDNLLLLDEAFSVRNAALSEAA